MTEKYIPGKTPSPDETGCRKKTSAIDQVIQDVRNLDVTDNSFDLALIATAIKGGIPLTPRLVDFIFGPKSEG